MAQRVEADHQGLQQFVTASTGIAAARMRLAHCADEMVEPVPRVVDVRLSEGRQVPAGRGQEVLRHGEVGGELPDRGECPRHD